MNTVIRLLATGVMTMLLAACAIDPKTYADATPEFRIEDYFAGETRAWGMIQKRSGEVSRRFTVNMTGEWQGDEFVLKEYFSYDDGETDYREWRIRVTGEHEYEGHAGDVEGVARGVAYGNALNWRYILNVEVDGSTWALAFNDWMYLQEDGVLINRAEFSKFGFRLGEVTIFFTKPDAQAASRDSR